MIEEAEVVLLDYTFRLYPQSVDFKHDKDKDQGEDTNNGEDNDRTSARSGYMLLR